MDNQQFRVILLKVSDQLNENDRKLFHSLVVNNISKRIHDDSSYNSILRVLESFLDHVKLNEQDYTFLIKAYNEIHCYDAVKLLQNCMTQIKKDDQKSAAQDLSLIVPNTMNESFEYQTNKNCVEKKTTNNYNINFVERSDANLKPVTFAVNHPLPRDSSSIKGVNIHLSIIQLCMTVFAIISIIMLANSTNLCKRKTSQILSELEKTLEIRDNIIMTEKLKINRTIEINNQLKNRINQFKNEKNRSFTIGGKQFCGSGGNFFDDSWTTNFSRLHYLRGIVFPKKFPFDWFQFLYSSPYFPDVIIEGEVHGTVGEKNIAERFVLDPDDRVNKVQVVCKSVTLIVNGVTKPVPLVQGVRLFSKKGRLSRTVDHVEGVKMTEQFDGYAVGYVTGKSGLLIDQIRFRWYRVINE